MKRYSLTRMDSIVNRWKNEGALIAILGSVLLIGVILAAGAVQTMILLGATILLGVYVYGNDRKIQNLNYASPAYVGGVQNGLQIEWLEFDENKNIFRTNMPPAGHRNNSFRTDW